MGRKVEAAYRAAHGRIVREQRVWHGRALAAESLMTFPVG
jgi:hypothetical protein